MSIYEDDIPWDNGTIHATTQFGGREIRDATNDYYYDYRYRQFKECPRCLRIHGEITIITDKAKTCNRCAKESQRLASSQLAQVKRRLGIA